MEFKLTEEQLNAAKIALDRYKNGYKTFTLTGLAGTGKSEIVNHVIREIKSNTDITEADICYCAYTGKACQVLKRKGNQNVSTLHKLLYTPIWKEDTQSYEFKPKSIWEDEYKIIVVDECSMVPKDMCDLLTHRRWFVFFLGDDHQLPPIDKDSNNGLLDHPDAKLTKIFRQEGDSDILDIAEKIINGETLQPYDGRDVKIINRSDLVTGMYFWADQILCATNATRKQINRDVRELLGYPEDIPVNGDKVICTKNYWNTTTINEKDPLINGTIGYLSNPVKRTNFVPNWISSPVRQFERIEAKINLPETNDSFFKISLDYKMLDTGEPTLPFQVQSKMAKSKRTAHITPKNFEYGYAISCWKAQGSQWEKVLIIEEGFPYDAELKRKFMYTALTRAEKKAVIVLNR